MLVVGAEVGIDMIVTERALGGGRRVFHGLEPHRGVATGSALLDHGDDMPQMAARTFQPLANTGMGCVPMRFCHTHCRSP